ncbi:MAG: rhomboid family intramembrane serine protease [Candidatus Aureabacteria bacterium]|nr:rhomboid family intramembrane serine protease [Candidatus Auribacterota bacterium]
MMNEYQSPLFAVHATSPAVKRLVIAGVVCFVLQQLVGDRFTVLFGLVPGLVFRHLYLWQLVTYLFLHASPLHLLFNMFALWMFGREVEMVLGTRRFCAFYFFCGAGAGLCSALLYAPGTVVMGASGAIFGLIVAFAMLFPDRVVTLLLFFVIPLRMRARQLVLLFAGVELLFIISSVRGDLVAHFAHLGGALFGYLYMRSWKRMDARPGLKRASPAWLRVSPEPDGGATLRARLDQVLDKIALRGYAGLTEEERELLRKAKDEL